MILQVLAVDASSTILMCQVKVPSAKGLPNVCLVLSYIASFTAYDFRGFAVGLMWVCYTKTHGRATSDPSTIQTWPGAVIDWYAKVYLDHTRILWILVGRSAMIWTRKDGEGKVCSSSVAPLRDHVAIAPVLF